MTLPMIVASPPTMTGEMTSPRAWVIRSGGKDFSRIKIDF